MPELDQRQLEMLREAIKLQKEKKALTQEQIKLLQDEGIYVEKNSKHYEDQLKNIQRYLDAATARLTEENKISEIIARQYEMQEAQVNIQNAHIRASREFLNDSERKLEMQQQSLQNALKEELQLKRLLKLHEKVNTEQELSAKELADLRRLQIKFGHKTVDQLKEMEKLAKDRKGAIAFANSALKDQVRVTKKTLILQEEQRDAAVDYKDAVKGVDVGIAGLFKKFIGLTDQSNSFIGHLDTLTEGGKNWGAAIDRVKMVWKGLATPINGLVMIVGALALATMKWMMDFSKETSNFQKTTGIIESGLGSIQNRINNVQRANIKYGVSMQEAFASAAALSTEIRGFNRMAGDSQDQLTRITALMGEFGASAQTTGAIFNVFSKGLGYNSQQLENLGLELTAISKSLGRPLQEVTEDFKAAMPELMKYGDGMTDVFTQLQEQSVGTGIAMQELLGIAKQFDTFEDAGNAVGRLNAILGGPYLNAMEMVHATEAERIQMMRDSVSATGRQFKDMERFEKQVIANAAGITDMSKAEMLFGSTDSAYADRAMDMQEMANRAQAAQSVQDKLTQAMQTFMIALGPLVTILSEVMDVLLQILQPFSGLNEAMPKTAKFLNTLTVLLAAGAIAWKAFGVNMATALAPVAVFVVMYLAIKKVLDLMEERFGPAGKAAMGLAVTLLAVGAGFMIASAGPTLGGSVLLWSAAIAAGLAGVAGMISGFGSMPKYALGIDNAPGGHALVGEAGPEMITTGGGAYMAEGPSVVDLPPGANVINNKNTEALVKRGGSAGAGGSIPPALIASLRQLQRAIEILNQNISADRQKDPAADQPVIITMDGKKLAETVISRINKRSKLTISKAG